MEKELKHNIIVRTIVSNLKFYDNTFYANFLIRKFSVDFQLISLIRKYCLIIRFSY